MLIHPPCFTNGWIVIALRVSQEFTPNAYQKKS